MTIFPVLRSFGLSIFTMIAIWKKSKIELMIWRVRCPFGSSPKLKLRRLSKVCSHPNFKEHISHSFSGIDNELKLTRKIVKEHEEHLEALENGEPFVPRLTGKKAPTANNKRKQKGKGKAGSSKRRKTTPDSDDDDDGFIVSDSDDSDSDQSDNTDVESDDELEQGSGGSDSEQEVEDLVSEDGLKGKIKEGKEKIKEHRPKLTEAKEQKKDASDKLARLKKSLAKAQREKNAFCSRKRSDVRRLFLWTVLSNQPFICVSSLKMC